MVIFKRKWLLWVSVWTSILPAVAQQKQESVTTVSINTAGGLKFDKVRFQVKPGAKVKLVLANKDDMLHNLVITGPGARIEVANAAMELGDKGLEMSYVPRTSKVLWSTKLIGPGETTSLLFTAPEKEGIYPYVCTYPGHGLLMFGAMYVTTGTMPPLENDPNIPSDAVGHGDQHFASHSSKPAPPYTKEPPFLYRIFVPDASPTAIVVSLPQNISYCWDAATCHLRYAWEGGFLDNTEIWKGHFQAYAKITGTVFFRNRAHFPLHPDKPGNIPAVLFKGYSLVNRYPEFHYTIDGIDVYELLKENADGSGLSRTFRIPKTDRVIWFVSTADDGVDYTSSVGKPVEGKLKFPAGENIRFTITMTRKEL